MQLSWSIYGAVLARYLRAQRGKVLLLGLLLLGSISLELLNPQIVRRFIDAAQAGRPLAVLWQVALLFLGAALLKYVLNVTLTYVSADVGWRATNALRTDLAAHCLQLDLGFHHRHPPGELIERIDGDVGQLARFFSQLVLQLLGNFLLLLGILAVLTLEEWRIGSGFLLFVIGALLILTWLRDFATPSMQAARAASADLFAFLEERLGGIEDIRANGFVTYTLQRLWAHLCALWRTSMVAGLRSALFGSFIVVWFELGTGLALVLGALLFWQDVVSLGTVYVLYVYMRMVSDPLLSMTSEIQHFQEATAGLLRVQALLDEPQMLPDGPINTLPSGPLPVDFANVTFAYPGDQAAAAPVLQNFNLTLPPGRILGLLGRTGSGKSTLTRLLLRFYDPQAGAVTVGGCDLRELSHTAISRHIGLVTQDVQLFNATVRDNLTFFDTTFTDAGIEQALTTVGLHDWLRALPAGLDTELSAAGNNLSAGEAQLLAFARILLKDPGVIILDEASSRLDPVTERRLDQAIARLLAGRTAIIIAHRLSTVQKVDEILILEEGRIRELGPRAQLAADPTSRFAHLLRTGLDFETML